MKKIKYFLFASIIINVLMLSIVLIQNNLLKEKKAIKTLNDKEIKMDYDITSNENFEKIFFDNNDSLYSVQFNEAFENQPEMALLISCTYYFITKNEKVLDDINLSISQLKEIYVRKFPALGK